MHDPERLSRGLGDEAIRRSPAPGKWSLVEIAFHLRHMVSIEALAAHLGHHDESHPGPVRALLP